ncbi:MAG: substrate-binding domain-containing protein [Syntrophaceae bacterium]|nr:substrate-binding domain-containing protein [Syntrophaceae bacterium]
MISLLRKAFYLSLLIAIPFAMPLHVWSSTRKLLLFAGVASKPPTEEAIQDFRRKTGISVEVVFGGSGFVLSQMKLTKRGDIYFPASSDFMEMAKREGLVFTESERRVAYLIPSINVQKGNPRGIHSLKDLTREGIRIAIANPEMVAIGLYAVEIVEKNFTPAEKERFRRNIVNYTESFEKTVNALSFRAVDTVIGWKVFQYWDPERIESIDLRPEEIPRIGYISIAISRFTKDKPSAQRFVDFLLSPQGKSAFRKYQYMMEIEEARRFTKPDTPVGGEYVLPKEWKTR